MYHEEIKNDPLRITKTKPFINKISDEINFPSKKVIGIHLRNIIKQLRLMVFMLKKQKHILLMFQNNSNREKQVIPLMILNGKRWHYLAVNKLSALLRRITSKQHSDFYCRNCLHSFAKKTSMNLIKKNCVMLQCFLKTVK